VCRFVRFLKLQGMQLPRCEVLSTSTEYPTEFFLD